MKNKSRSINNFKIGVFISRLFLYIILILLAIICIAPFVIMIINSTLSTQEIMMGISLIPGKRFLDNYNNMIELTNIWRGFLNSIIVSVSYTILAVYFGALTAYAFSKFKFRGKRIIFWIVLGSMMVPAQLGIVGFYKLISELSMIDSFWPLILPGIACAYTVFFLKMYIDANVDNSLIEAARIDGSKEFSIFNFIVLPIISPALATMAILNFMASWNNYFTPLIVLFSKEKYTMPIMIANIKGLLFKELSSQYVAITISVVPIIIIFMLLSRYIISGISSGSIKE